MISKAAFVYAVIDAVHSLGLDATILNFPATSDASQESAKDVPN